MGPAVITHPARWSLLSRLLTGLVTLLFVLCLISGVVTAVALQQFLADRLDAQLVAAGGRSAGAEGGGGHGLGGPSPAPDPDGDGPRDNGVDFLRSPGQLPGTVGVRIVGGDVSGAGRLTQGGSLEPLTATQAANLASLPVDARPRTTTVDGIGEFRVLVSRVPGQQVLITGLPMQGIEDTVYRLAAVEVGVTVALLLAAALVGALIIRRTLDPLRRVAATAGRVSTQQLDRGDVVLAERVADADTDAGAEVGQVGLALNRLLDHVSNALMARQASESRVRQFVADASHELRTPLAAIRGYAEATRRSTQAPPPDIARAMSRVESEAARMTTLVDDLLLLARLDSGRPLAREPLDVTRLLVDVVSDAAATGPDHTWTLQLPDEPVTVTGDQERLHQVVANLLANARTHTPSTTSVRTSLRQTDSSVELTVSDDGPGIPPGQQARVFERFARGDSSRSRAAGSTGLGLAIVQGIVAAHGGTVEVSSRPGDTRFVVRLPLA